MNLPMGKIDKDKMLEHSRAILPNMFSKIDSLENEVSGLKQDMSGLKQDIKRVEELLIKIANK
jgi:peptidoglycan hydrolase CwlO-like protein